MDEHHVATALERIEEALEKVREAVAMIRERIARLEQQAAQSNGSGALRERVAKLEQITTESTKWQEDFDKRRLKDLVPAWQAIWVSRIVVTVAGTGAAYAVVKLIEAFMRAYYK